jgi:hypothetical protein
MYRIYCEDVYREMIESVLQSRVEGYTIIEAQECYQRAVENSLIVELWDVNEPLVESIATEIANVCDQQCVAYTHVPCEIKYATQTTQSTKKAGL